jgi:PPK2 family polyphosphate:nucleotide phosphotransferase
MANKQSSKPRLSDWQPPAGKAAAKFSLDKLDPAAKPWSLGDKAADAAQVEQLSIELDGMQNMFYADKRFKLLVVLQGTDGSGKDGTVRGVFSRTSPLGVHTVGWKAPTEEERDHDFLWRIHKAVPGAGEITVFNRSHYEDVLVPVVNQWITPEQTAQRMQQIRDFERMLSETGTVILKFLLHISPEEQRERLQERIDDPAKNWKFAIGDIDVRKQWADYRKAYNALLRETSTDYAPWTVVPANSKTHRNLMIATVVRDTLAGLKLRYPPADPKLVGMKIT